MQTFMPKSASLDNDKQGHRQGQLLPSLLSGLGGHSCHTEAQLPLFAEDQGLLSEGREGPVVRCSLAQGG